MRKLAVMFGTIGLATISALNWHARAQDRVPGVTPPVTTGPGQASPAIRYRMFLDDGTPVRPSTGLRLKEAETPSIKEKSAGRKGKIDQSKIQPPNLLATPNADRNLNPHAPSDQDETYRVRVKFPWLTPESSSTGQRAGELSAEKGKGKIDQSKIQPPNLLANPEYGLKVERGALGGEGGGEGKANYNDKSFTDRTEKASDSLLARPDSKGKSKDRDKERDDDAELNAAACRAALAARKPLPSFCKPTVYIDRTLLDRLEADRVEQLRTSPGGFNPNKP